MSDTENSLNAPSGEAVQIHHSIGRFRAFAPAGCVPAPPLGHGWDSLMQEALVLAGEAGRCGEVPVGALVVDGRGHIVGRGRNACIAGHDATAHAEIMALRQAGQTLGNYRLGGCVLVVTLEPCAMCAAAIVQARVDGLVYGAADSLAGAVCSRAEYLDAPAAPRPVWHMGGVLSAACSALLQDFFAMRREKG